MKSLVIEDDATCRKVFKAFFEKFGVCDIASNGAEGLDLYKKSLINGEAYNLAVIDIILPDINGNEVLKSIRKEEDIAGIQDYFRTRVVITTSLDDEKNREIAQNLEHGLETYYVKSFANEGLYEKLAELGLPNY